MEETIESAILDKTCEIITLFNRYFIKELATAVDLDYIRPGANEYYEGVLKDMYRKGYIRLKIAPMIGTNIYWYENEDGELWKHEIPGRLTNTGNRSIVSAACSWNKDDYIINTYDYPYSY